MRPRTLLWIAFVLAAAGGCRPDFAPFNRLTGLRVLGIHSEPPTPATGETGALSALIFTPTPDDPTLTYSWSWCPFPGPAGGGHECLVNENQVTAIAEAMGVTGQIPPFDLGSAPTAMLPNVIDARALEMLCTGVPGAPRAPDCTGGFPVQISLTVTISDPNTGVMSDKVDAVFTTRWRFVDSTGAIPDPNTNPTIDSLGVSATPTMAAQEIPQTGMDVTITAPTLPRDTATALEIGLNMDAVAESFTGPDDNGVLSPQTERLFVTWFIETGGSKYSRTGYIKGSTEWDVLLRNEWSPARKKDYPSDDARLFVVIHDSRNGAGWRSGFVHLDPTP